MWAGTLTWARPVEEALGLVDLRHRVGRPGQAALRRRTAPARPRDGHPRPAGGADSRRARHRAGPGEPALHLAAGARPAGVGHHGDAEHPQRGRSRGAGGPPRDPAPGQDRPGRHPGRGDCVLAGPGLVHASPRTPAIQSRTCRALYGRRSSREAPAARCFVHTQDVQPTLAALLGWARSHGVELTDLNARSAPLEEALLAVAESATGHTQDQEMTA